MLLCGGTFELARMHARVTGRCLQMWIARFNEEGIDGITYRPKTGRPRLLTPAQVEKEILPLVDDPGLADQTHWTATKLVGWLAAEKQLELSCSTLVRYPHEHGYKRKISRPMPEPKDREVWEDQRDTFAFELLDLLNDKRCEVFFGDEAGFEGDPRPHQKWARRGERITQG